MSQLSTVPVADLARAVGRIAGARVLSDDDLRRVVGLIVWRWFDKAREEPIPGIPRLPFVKAPKIGQLRALLEHAFGPRQVADDAPVPPGAVLPADTL